MNSHLKGSLLIAAAIILFSLQAVFFRLIKLDVKTIFVYYEIMFLVLITIVMLSFGKKDQFMLSHPPKLLVFFVISLIITQITFFSAIRLTTFANVIFLYYTAPIFTLIFAVIFLKEKFEWQSLGAIILATIGIILIGRQNILQGNIIGMVLSLVSGVTYSIVTILNKKLVQNDKNFGLIFYQTWPIAIAFLPFLFFEMPRFGDLLLILLLTVFAGLIPALLYLKGLQAVKAQHVGVISYIEVFFMVLFGYLFFKEVSPLIVWIGGLFIIGSGVWIIIDEYRDKSS